MMFRKRLAVVPNLFLLLGLLLAIQKTAWSGDRSLARDNSVGHHFSGGDRGYRGIHGFRLFKKDPYVPGQPKRYFDATGRWTGDGYDSMSTAQPSQTIYCPN